MVGFKYKLDIKLFILVNITLMSLKNSESFGLVTVRLTSAANEISLV
jgi:hypothetical protein